MLTRLLQALSGPLLVDPRFGARFAALLRQKFAGGHFTGLDLHAALGIAQPRTRTATEAPKIAVIPIQGIIAQHPQSLGTSTDEIGAAFDAALVNPQIEAIVFDVDSPGGTVSGVPELAAKILAARGVKPVIASINSLAASAGYWLASAADQVLITPSGEAGSIGVYTMHEDWSKNLEQEGIAVTPVSAGKFKLEGAPWAPLGEAGLVHLQAQVDEVYDWFVKAIATQRKDSQANVRNGYGEGRVVLAEQAVALNLADAIGTFEDALVLAAKKALAGRKGPRAEATQREVAVERLR